MTAQDQSQTQYDVIVVGSGAGAMTSAVFLADQGFSVLVLEKSDKFGGTSAISGGGIWIPNNHYFARLGGNDSMEQARRYLDAAAGDQVDPARLQAYLDNAPKMIEALTRCSRVRYAVAAKYPDYYPHLPGALPGGRTLDPELFDSSLLGAELDNLRKPSPSTLLMGRIAWTARDAHKAMARGFGWRLLILRLMLRYKLDFKWRRRSRFDRRAALGSSLVCSLRRSLMDRDVPLWLNSDFRELIMEQGRVSGVRIYREGRELALQARHGVILASGGFEQNQALREQYLPKPTRMAWSATPPGNNTGAALQAGLAQGAATALMDWAWWAPTIAVPGEDKPRGIFAERAFPGAIVVNGEGRRFVNEAAPYLEFVDAMHRDNARTGGGSVPAWVIFDGHFRFNYAMGPLMPAQVMPDSRLRPEWSDTLYWKADSLEALAGKIGVDAQGLASTVAKVNDYARTGVDLDFGRGGNVFDRYYGDCNIKPNPCLAPLRKGPYYAMRLDAGDIGTKGGLLTNAQAQVLREDGSVIAGLYAIGNCSASVMGTSYPGAGGTLGPAMTFAYVAANHLAAKRREVA
ncbi:MULTISPECIES: FAD-binding protein [Pseudomonas]|uniref:FAD-dependent oxidoreductase n=1 Tax=Pseudomonas pudica TaxID=272772 RepID=A0ABS0FVG9_9PSED|nr:MULTISPECIES: FAD-binding protein [Pseudomonas]MBF8644356.1 FAD-dependent oxidoreductase [Pseudomonas pudica]MBF8707874.1 FAD-dependent oxidoreductase [Pseudomonas putida]MBF8759215.1 FAD-dependent oxidoreductase [Pseudomonas pudica]